MALRRKVQGTTTVSVSTTAAAHLEGDVQVQIAFQQLFLSWVVCDCLINPAFGELGDSDDSSRQPDAISWP